MRIKEISGRDVPPVRVFDVSDLTDVVVLAGPNGVGKTRLVQALIQFFRSPSPGAQVRLKVEATNPDEVAAWGKEVLDTMQADDVNKLRRTLQTAKKRSDWRSSVIHIESDRSIQQVRPFAFTWDLPDPWGEDYGWDGTFGGLRSRFEDTIHSIFRKVQSRRDRIGRAVEAALKTGPVTVLPDDYPDPLLPFKRAFSQLLSPKELVEPDLRRQQLSYLQDGHQFALDQLSSGEREVVNIVFDFLLRNPSDCIVFFDEPELHLHPELSYKLLQTLKMSGQRNQFVFCTHSPDIITASLDHSVIFIAPPQAVDHNQALPVKEDDETNQALRLLGHSVGIVALGRRIVLIEGQTASLDKQVYGAILKNKFPELVLVPSGGRGILTSFASVNAAVLERTIWGVEFFMLCDRDAVPLSKSVEDLERQSRDRLRVLPRYHLENYFLDSDVLARIFEQMEPPDSWLRSPRAVEERLRKIASATIPYAVALQVSAEFRDQVGNLTIMPKGCHQMNEGQLVAAFADRVSDERQRITAAIEQTAVESRVRELYEKFTKVMQDDGTTWKLLIPGRPILNTFANLTRFDPGRLKTMFIRATEHCNNSPFEELEKIFVQFARYGS